MTSSSAFFPLSTSTSTPDLEPRPLPFFHRSLSFLSSSTDVVMHGLMDPKDAAKATTALEKEFGVRALFSSADVTKPAEIRAMIKQTQGDLGSLDILCNNVGIQHVESVVDFPEDK
jgi:3-hydroxybutyrate dehydrogenase